MILRSSFILSLGFILLFTALRGYSYAEPPTSAEPLADFEIQKLFEGNTVSGRYTDGRPFSEFHHADGHAYGQNRGIPNIDACWIVQPGKVCYYYGPQQRRTLFCFTVTKTGENYVLTNAPPNTYPGTINALARVSSGNNENLNDNGKPWVCDGLLSFLYQKPSKFAILK